MLVLATTVFGLSFLTYGLMFFPFLLVLFLFGISLGIFGCALVLRLGRLRSGSSGPCPPSCRRLPGLLSAFDVASVDAVDFVPAAAVVCVRRHAADRRRRGSLGIFPGGGRGPGRVYIFLACRYFASVYHHAQRTGLIARYSAETLS